MANNSTRRSAAFLSHYRKIQCLTLNQELDQLCDHRDSLGAEDPYLPVVRGKIEDLMFKLQSES